MLIDRGKESPERMAEGRDFPARAIEGSGFYLGFGVEGLGVWGFGLGLLQGCSYSHPLLRRYQIGEAHNSPRGCPRLGEVWCSGPTIYHKALMIKTGLWGLF